MRIRPQTLQLLVYVFMVLEQPTLLVQKQTTADYIRIFN